MFGLSTAVFVGVVAAVGAIVAALIAAFVSLLGLIISKEQKISEFRQVWIDSLREDTASLIAHADVVFTKSLGKTLPEAADLLAVNEASVKIKLRLNPKESESIAVLKALAEHETHISACAEGKAITARQLVDVERELVEAMQKVLKREWNRVRSGETIYRSARAAAIVVTTSCILALIALGFLVWQMAIRGHLN